MYSSNYNYNSMYPRFNDYSNMQNSVPIQQTQTQQPIQLQNVNWIQVNGIEGAKNHIVQPNQSAWLMDNNECKFYVKTSDNLGVTTLKAYEFREIDVNSKAFSNDVQVNLQDYVKKAEIEEIIENKIRAIAQSELKKDRR